MIGRACGDYVAEPDGSWAHRYPQASQRNQQTVPPSTCATNSVRCEWHEGHSGNRSGGVGSDARLPPRDINRRGSGRRRSANANRWCNEPAVELSAIFSVLLAPRPGGADFGHLLARIVVRQQRSSRCRGTGQNVVCQDWFARRPDLVQRLQQRLADWEREVNAEAKASMRRGSELRSRERTANGHG